MVAPIDPAGAAVLIPFANAAVAQAFVDFPIEVTDSLLAVRQMIFETAASLGVGELEETLKWGQPAYLTAESKSGTTIRLGWKATRPIRCGLFVHCQTDLIERFRVWYSDLEFEGNRAILFEPLAVPPRDVLSRCIAAALTYHRDRRALLCQSE